MNVLIKNMEMPKGCIYANDNDQTEYCPLLNHDDVPFCQYIENEPEIAIGIDERPVYCPLSDVPEPCENTVSRQAVIDALEKVAELYPWRVPGDSDSYSSYNEAWQDALNRVGNEIEALPSAQSERNPDEWCHDCKEYDQERHCCPRFNQVIRQTLSEQPEIIRCKDCTKREICRTSTVWAVAPGDDWYCADAERRTDG